MNMVVKGLTIYLEIKTNTSTKTHGYRMVRCMCMVTTSLTIAHVSEMNLA